MTKRTDPALLEIAARFSTQSFIDESKTAMPAIRKAATEARRGLVGRHAADVEVAQVGAMRRFTPKTGLDRSCVIIYVHGGGWVNCDSITHGAVMTDLAYLTGHEVLGPDYPLAPEHPYPAGLDHVMDLVAKTRAARPDVKLVLAGDSAGANLALAVAAKLRDTGQGGAVLALLLWYGCFRAKFDTRSHAEFGSGEFGLTTEAMRHCWDWYLDGQDSVAAPYGDLGALDVTGLPPAWMCEAELDCLADDTRWLAALYAEAGIDHSYDLFTGVNHGFNHFGQFYSPSLRSIERAAHFLKRL
ncbi:alpha/beta hydrolase fold domain-containing protein [Celeribacter marinus]|uniref:Esterase/lipase n=1 Tax=Celeribacter marinus TaxID=1397108 RepID=A0A0P0A4B4_9RHOB|nr:alpha/beta hydrolase fold domain-containing protein [Celeribacter marinus]ALI55337.1 esterase/lipase [Celeribacter marinus]SFL07589.1 acetyl esterase [Celeribacter marinus]